MFSIISLSFLLCLSSILIFDVLALPSNSPDLSPRQTKPTKPYVSLKVFSPASIRSPPFQLYISCNARHISILPTPLNQQINTYNPTATPRRPIPHLPPVPPNPPPQQNLRLSSPSNGTRVHQRVLHHRLHHPKRQQQPVSQHRRESRREEFPAVELCQDGEYDCLGPRGGYGDYDDGEYLRETYVFFLVLHPWGGK